MKKALSVFLACLLFVTCLAPIAASAAKVFTPVVYVGGQQETIYSDKTNAKSKTYFTGDLPKEALDEISSSLRPALIKALAGRWDDYLNGYYEAAMPYYSEITLNNNGLPTNKTGYDCLKEKKIVDKSVNGRYNLKDYVFVYDWRLDPCANAEDLDAYINSVLRVTGAQKVDIVAVGIGCSTVLAYMQAKGTEKIKSIVFDSASMKGSDVYGAFFSNQIEQDEEALAVFVAEVRRNVALLQMVKSSVSAESWNDMISVKATRKVYGKLYETAIPRIIRDVYGTMPGYWSMIGKDYFDDAIDYIFGDYEVAKENAVLLQKINNYHNKVQKKIPWILKDASDSGVEIYNIVNYGFHMVPVNEKSNTTSDVYVSVPNATYGAKTAPYGETLGEDYIEELRENGNAGYLSPDGEINAGTGYFASHTWFVKNLEHGESPAVVEDLITAILNHSTYTTVFSLSKYPQYLYCSNDRLTLSPLTETGLPEVDEEEEAANDPKTGITNFFDYIKKIVNAIMSLVMQMIEFGQSQPFSSQFENIGNTTEPSTDGAEPTSSETEPSSSVVAEP